MSPDRACAGAARRVAVIGGGWAGCAAALALAEAGANVTLYEAAATLGGRARRVERDGLPLDNGQHLMLGAYAQALAAIERAHGREDASRVLRRQRLAIVPFARPPAGALSLARWRLPGRAGLLAGLATARGLTIAERAANLRWFRALEREAFARPPGETVERMLAPLPPRVAGALWEPLCIAALNTAPASASAQVFANVLREAFLGPADASDFVVPATDLAAVFPEAAARQCVRRGGSMRTGVRAEVVSASETEVSIGAAGSVEQFAAAIVAVGPHQLPRAISGAARARAPALTRAIEGVATLAYEPIVTVWLGYAERLDLPARILRLDDAPGQWAFDRGDIVERAGRATPLAGVVAVVVSASGPHDALAHDALARAADAQLRRLRPSLPSCAWSQVIAERRATYACTPGRFTPAGPRVAPRLYLAGDYVDAAFPATLEAAVRSGHAAARALLADLET